MNRNTFVFGIGGTGARVIRALTMLLASGVKINHSGKIIPVIIDVDAENEDTSRTIKALNLYKEIRTKALGQNQDNVEGFFGTNLNTLSSQKANDANDDGRIRDEFQLKFAGISSTFSKYLKVEEMEGIDEQFLKLLYDSSPKNSPNTELNLELTKGFKGNPNIGCIIFNELENSPEYKYFQNSIGDGDRIFVISSIFGGTGSSGFPQLLKLLKNSKNNRVRSAKTGAITIMPYFAVQEDKNSAIDSNRFISKTKAALAYYADDHEMNQLNSMYYIYDKAGTVPYENKEGGREQKNDAHIIELIAATSIINFTNKADEAFPNSTEFYEFGIRKNDTVLDIRHFFEQTKKSILHPLTSFTFAVKAYLEHIPKKTGEAFAKELNLRNELSSNIFYLSLTRFAQDHYLQWLMELERNSRTFKPFSLNSDFNSLVIGKQIETGFFRKGIDERFLIEHIGRLENELQKTIPEKEKRFLSVLNGLAKKCFEKLEKLPAMV